MILDTVRAAELSLYGYGRPTTPELERWAERGTVFERAFSPASWTLPSHASIFTGRPELLLGATHWDRLGSDWPTLAEVLHGRGYGTVAFVANADWAGWDSGLGRGFEHYDDYPVSLWTAISATSFGRVIYPMLYDRLPGRLQWLPGRLRLRHPVQHRSAAAISSAFLGWLDDRPRAPYFAFLNFMDAHTPYTPPDSFRNRYRTPMPRPASRYAYADRPPIRLTPTDMRPRQDLYDGSIAYLDSEIGRLLDALEQRGGLENTLVVLTADHGEEFAEHGLGGHGSTLYRLSVQVPLVLWFPGRIPAGRRVASPVSLHNLAATVLDLAAPGPGGSRAARWRGSGGARTRSSRIRSSRRCYGRTAVSARSPSAGAGISVTTSPGRRSSTTSSTTCWSAGTSAPPTPAAACYRRIVPPSRAWASASHDRRPRRPVAWSRPLGGDRYGCGRAGQVRGDLWFSDFTMRSRDAIWMVPAVDGAGFRRGGPRAGAADPLGPDPLVARRRAVRGARHATGPAPGPAAPSPRRGGGRRRGRHPGRSVGPAPVPASVRAVCRGLPWLVGAVLLTAGASWAGGPWPSGGWRPRVPRRPPGRPVCSC